MADRAVSTTLNYALTLAISTLLVGGLLVAGSTFVDDQRKTVIDSELEVLGQRLADDIATADRLVRASAGSPTVRISTSVPATVGGSTYTIDVLTDDGNASLRLRTHELDRSVTVNVANETEIDPGSVSNDEIEIVYAGGTLEVRDA